MNCPWCNAILPENITAKDFCPACYTTLDSTIPREPYNVPKPKTPVTTALILINLAIFCAMLVAGRSMSVGNGQSLHWGADWGPLSLHFQWWRMLTSTFIHGSWIHIIDNLLVLWILGRRAERVFGRLRFLALYLITGVAGSMAALAVIPEAVSYGASGGIFGVFGALLMAWHMGKLPLSRWAKWGLGIVALLMVHSLYSNLTDPEIANSAHVAGFISGLILGGAMLSARINKPQFRRWVYSAATVFLLSGMISLQYAYSYLALLAPAEQEITEGRYDEALVHLNMVLQHNPDSALANAYAADCYLLKHDYIKAEAAAKRSLKTDPDNFVVTLTLARIYVKTHRSREAQALAQSVLGEKGPKEAALVFAAAIETESTDEAKH